MIKPTKEEAAAQEEVAMVARQLSGIRYGLKKIAATMPAPEPGNAGDLDDEPDIATELRSTIECVVTDRLTPAISDLETASLYRPARARAARGEDDEEPA
jgi:hypothetical protein